MPNGLFAGGKQRTALVMRQFVNASALPAATASGWLEKPASKRLRYSSMPA